MRLRAGLALAAAVALAGACQPGAPQMTEAQRTAIADSVKAASQALFASVPTRNTDSVMTFFVADDRLTWADVGMIYPSRDSVVRSMRGSFAGMSALTLTTDEPKIMVLDRNAAVLTTTFHESFTDTTGATQTVNGAWSAVYHRSPGGWKIVQAHASLPMPAPARRR